MNTISQSFAKLDLTTRRLVIVAALAAGAVALNLGAFALGGQEIFADPNQIFDGNILAGLLREGGVFFEIGLGIFSGISFIASKPSIKVAGVIVFVVAMLMGYSHSFDMIAMVLSFIGGGFFRSWSDRRAARG